MVQSFQKWLKYSFRKTETRLILFLSIAVFFIILIVSITSYETSKSVLQKELNEPQQQMLQVGMDFIDKHISESDKVAIKVALDTNVYRFLNSDKQNSYSNITEIYQLLSTLINSSSYINSIYIYDLKHDSFVSVPQGFSSRKSTFFDSKWVDVADEFGDEKMIVKKRSVNDGKKYDRSEVTLFRKIMIQGEFKGIVALNLGYHDLFEPFNSPDMANLSTARFIIDQNNEMIYSTSSPSSPKLNTKAVVSAISELNEEHLGDIAYKDQQLLVSQNISPLTGWKYVSLVPQDSLLAKSKKVGHVVLSVSIMALLLGGVAIFYINSIAFRPIRRMKELFNIGNKDIDHHDLLHLETLAGELLNNHAQLSHMIHKVRSEASAKFFSDIYHNNLTNSREIEEKCLGYFQETSNKPLKVAIISIDHFSHWSDQYPSSDHSLLKFALANILTETLESYSHSECVDLGKDKLLIVLHPSSDEKLLDSKLKEALSIVPSLLEFSISIGISSQKSDIGSLAEAILEADTALGNRLYSGYGSLLKSEELTQWDSRKLSMVSKVLDHLREAIDTGDSERTSSLIGQIIEDIRGSRLNPERAFSIIKMINDRSLRIGQDEDKGRRKEKDFFQYLHTFHIDDVAEFLTEQANDIIQGNLSIRTSKESLLIEKMIEYMKDHLDEPIGITEIVDSIGISVSLASSIFKKEMNETIYGYFTGLRMKRAADLLVNTDEKISDIAIKVGYQHENSFIRAFRKCNNITPGKYREVFKSKREVI
ncbi:helix-turn-helix domain-containing protein [Mesobacillus foraminis]|uniref:AraC-like DNA-binding protein n=1 Tax=Mesobacillus foraminis TaxID=279826 RepID=A0A4R2BFR1_9BACI|nr:helix-turn-helix domain-containing protein [Mesobacillus foraminis]TCN25353.1 AraC-like DNA-binding protein [Mesobacillus foraminis]